MPLVEEELKRLYELAKSAATKAGSYIASKQGKKIATQEKIGGENIASCVVTEVDLQAQEIILQELTPSCSKYHLGLLAEENEDDSTRFQNEYFWCIDPLDGTLCFSQDEDGYSCSIALVRKDGIPIIGAVFNPRSNTLYHALKGHGSFKNQEFLKKREGHFLTLLYDQSYTKHPQFQEDIKFLEKKAHERGLEGVRLHHLGGAVMNGISTIEMGPALYYKYPKKVQGGGSLWDFAASSIIQQEAGGFNSDFYYNPLALNQSHSTFMNHKGIIYATSEDLLEMIPKYKKLSSL